MRAFTVTLGAALAALPVLAAPNAIGQPPSSPTPRGPTSSSARRYDALVTLRAQIMGWTSITRTEGHATGWEEVMLHAGMFDARPRTRELIYTLLAQRAARALGDLRMHSNEMTLGDGRPR